MCHPEIASSSSVHCKQHAFSFSLECMLMFHSCAGEDELMYTYMWRQKDNLDSHCDLSSVIWLNWFVIESHSPSCHHALSIEIIGVHYHVQLLTWFWGIGFISCVSTAWSLSTDPYFQALNSLKCTLPCMF